MKPDWNRPDRLCWMFIPLWIIFGVINGDHTLDIQLHDTYYVISYTHFSLTAVLVFFLWGLFYNWLNRGNRRLERKLIAGHLALAISGFLILFLITFVNGGITDSRDLSMNPELSYAVILLIFVGLISVLLGFLLLVINMVRSLS